MLLSDGRLQLFVVEDWSRRRESRILSACAVVFVTDAFCSEARTSLPPYLGIQLTMGYGSRQLPLLNRGQIAKRNAREGLNVVMCFEGWDRDQLSPEQFSAVREKQSEAFRIALGGYHLKEFLANPIGGETFAQMLDAGARLRRDYSEYFRRNGHPMPRPALRPRLVGLRREEALTHLGSQLADLFVYSPPRFAFSPAQQELLQQALLGETSLDLSKSLFISHATVKKRWRAIYQKVADSDLPLLDGPLGNGVDANKRGAEHRRHLLYYLRQHPEELRPFDPGNG